MISEFKEDRGGGVGRKTHVQPVFGKTCPQNNLLNTDKREMGSDQTRLLPKQPEMDHSRCTHGAKE